MYLETYILYTFMQLAQESTHQSKTSRFDLMRAGLTDLGIAEVPRCTAHLTSTCPVDLPTFSAIAFRRASYYAGSRGAKFSPCTTKSMSHLIKAL